MLIYMYIYIEQDFIYNLEIVIKHALLVSKNTYMRHDALLNVLNIVTMMLIVRGIVGH